MFRYKTKKTDRELAYDAAFYDTFISDWKTKKEMLVEEFDRVKAMINSFGAADFKDTAWTLAWKNHRPNKSALEIGDAIMFLVHAEPYLQLRKQQVELNIQKNEDPSTWANLHQKLLETYEALQAISDENTQSLIDALASSTFLTIARGSHKDFELFFGSSYSRSPNYAKRKRSSVSRIQAVYFKLAKYCILKFPSRHQQDLFQKKPSPKRPKKAW